jgi:hypothetical protein
MTSLTTVALHFVKMRQLLKRHYDHATQWHAHRSLGYSAFRRLEQPVRRVAVSGSIVIVVLPGRI